MKSNQGDPGLHSGMGTTAQVSPITRPAGPALSRSLINVFGRINTVAP